MNLADQAAGTAGHPGVFSFWADTDHGAVEGEQIWDDGAHAFAAARWGHGEQTGRPSIAKELAGEHHRKKVGFFATVDLVNALEQEKAINKAGQLAECLLRLDLVILDELGCLPFSPSGGALLFHLLSKLCERANVIITNLSFSEWAGVFGDAQDDHGAARPPDSSLPHH